MMARFPASVVAADQAPWSGRADVLRALVDVAGDGTVVRFSLVDARGDTQLRRTLPAPGRGRPLADCLALADTLATIVERYLNTIAYDAADGHLSNGDPLSLATVVATPAVSPVQPVPSRTAFVLVGLGWRMPTAGPQTPGAIEARIGTEVELTVSNPRLAGVISLGASPALVANNLDENRTASLRRFPARLGASLKLPVGPGWIEPALALGLDLLAISSTAGGSSAATQTFRLEPGLEAAIGYRVKVAGFFHVRPWAAFGVAIQRYNVGAQDNPGGTIFETPRAHASLGIDTGVVFQ